MTDPESPRPDDETTEDESPASAFEIDLDPEDQGTADAGAEPSG